MANNNTSLEEWIELCRQTFSNLSQEDRKEYGGKYIAINGNEVVDSDKKLDVLIRRYSRLGSSPVEFFRVNPEGVEERFYMPGGKPTL